MDAVSLANAAEPRIHGDGNAEADWARCQWLQDMAVVALPALLKGSRRLLVIAPHPDDEALGCGGLMWTARQSGLEVAVVSVTNGEACYPGMDAHALATTRHAELLAAAATLGIPARNVRALGVPDGGVTGCETLVEERLAALVQPSDLVLATWEHDGHPDHEGTARAARRAATTVGARYASYPVWAWHWLDVNASRHRFNGGVRFELSPAARAAKRQAVARFESQLRSPARFEPILPPHVVARFDRPFEVVLP